MRVGIGVHQLKGSPCRPFFSPTLQIGKRELLEDKAAENDILRATIKHIGVDEILTGEFPDQRHIERKGFRVPNNVQLDNISRFSRTTDKVGKAELSYSNLEDVDDEAALGVFCITIIDKYI